MICNKEKVQFLYEFTTGFVLVRVAVIKVSIYRDTYHIALHVSRYVLYRMTAVSSQPYCAGGIK